MDKQKNATLILMMNHLQKRQPLGAFYSYLDIHTVAINF